jgi:uncharacterized membrane protein YccC
LPVAQAENETQIKFLYQAVTTITVIATVSYFVMMHFIKDCFYVLAVLFLLAMCFISPNLTTKVSFIALLIASLVVIYLVREVDDSEHDPSFDPQATMGFDPQATIGHR